MKEPKTSDSSLQIVGSHTFGKWLHKQTQSLEKLRGCLAKRQRPCVCVNTHDWQLLTLKWSALLWNCRWLTRHPCLTPPSFTSSLFQSPPPLLSLWKCATPWLNLAPLRPPPTLLLTSTYLFEDQRAFSGSDGLRQLCYAALVEVRSWETAVVDVNLGATVSAVGWACDRRNITNRLQV